MKIKLKKQIQEAVGTGSSLQQSQYFCYWRQVLVPDAQWGERGLEQEKVYCQDKQGECVLMLKILNSLTALSRKFLKAKFRVRAAGCDFLLIDCWKSTRVVLQESCAQFEVTILSGGLSSCRRIQSYYYTYFFKRSQDPAPRLYYYFLTAPPLFCIPCFPGLIMVWIGPLEIREGSWRLNEACCCLVAELCLILLWPHEL